jgi:alpha-1,3-rhamnosyl/mannosyltransferase
MAEGLQRLLSDKALRETLCQRGLAHAARFTWQQTAAETLLVYGQALGKDGQV